jgi:hypothetical protein
MCSEIDAPGLAAVHDVEEGAALHLVEELLVRVVVEVGALVGAADDGDDEIRVLPHLRVAHGRLEQVLVLVDPLREVERFHLSGRSR